MKALATVWQWLMLLFRGKTTEGRRQAGGGGARPRGWMFARRLRRVFLRDAVVMRSRLSVRVLRLDGRVEDLGVIATRVVTTMFVNLLCDYLQAIGTPASIGNFKYHGLGTGTNAEAIGDVALQTPAETRDAGNQLEGATANVYKTVATHTYAGPFAITEHGLFDASTSGNLMDRSVFAAINVVSGDKIESTYELTLTAGG